MMWRGRQGYEPSISLKVSGTTGIALSDNDDPNDRPPAAGPWGAPPRVPVHPPPKRPGLGFPASPRPAARGRRPFWSVAAFILIILGVGIRAYKDVSRPEAWAYWKELYFSPSMTSSVITNADLAGSGNDRPALALSGTIGRASASWFRGQLNDAHLAAGDLVLLSSPGGDVNQAMIMGEIIRSRGLVTAVGVADGAEHIKPSYCASACVLVYAGGKNRLGVEGSALGVHRFVTSISAGGDLVAETQRLEGAVLSYMTKMGVSSAVVEAMSATKNVRWLGAQEAVAMNLITAPARTP
jgi:hypothetical protein